MMTQEVFKPIPGYEGSYEVSNLGNVKSIKFNKEKILSPFIAGMGYLTVVLSNKGLVKNFYIHKLVAISFLGHKPNGMKLVVDHINNIKTDNRLSNLQLVTQRENAYKTQGKYSSQYKGVSWSKHRSNWKSSILINGKRISLGNFNTEHEAHLAYQNALQKHLSNEQSIQASTQATENIC